MRLSRAGLHALPLAAALLIAVPGNAASDPATETEHVVTAGETLSGIANRAKVPLVAIAEANGLSEPYVVKLGQKLIIPRQRVHVVKAGDTGFAIGFQYGVPFDLIAQANGIKPDATLKVGKRLIIPAVISNPRPIEITQPSFRRPHDGAVLLGWRRRADGSGHEGVDFRLKDGDMVRAAASGTVIFAGKAPERFGNLVVIDHGNGWHTAYGHLQKATVKKGETIRAGERVGLGGHSGEATGPELHFEIRRDGQPVDPGPLLGLKEGG
ncbi:M23 family metallopeptidase [Altererythrobacter fulvus]|uniref:M23 family metallopeptidase n=1 Tax=Caenibius fulvus TaxID=2126012 RepID=UPI00301775DA